MKRTLVGALLTSAASLAIAADNAWYIGGALGQSEFGDCRAGASCDRRDSAYKVYAGYQFTPRIAMEVAYVDLGKTTILSGISATESKPRGGTAHLVATWPLAADVSLIGRVGLIYGDTKVTGSGGIRNPKGTESAWGVGAQYAFNRHFIVRLEWERLRFEPLEVDALTLGLATTF